LGIPHGYNSHRSRLGRDNRPKLFRKTNISNDVAGALHPVVGRSGPDTVGLFTFLTFSDFPRASPNDLPIGSCSPANEAEVRRLPHAKAGSNPSRDEFLEFKAFVTLTAW
jgi:hypothetical protein